MVTCRAEGEKVENLKANAMKSKMNADHFFRTYKFEILLDIQIELTFIHIINSSKFWKTTKKMGHIFCFYWKSIEISIRQFYSFSYIYIYIYIYVWFYISKMFLKNMNFFNLI